MTIEPPARDEPAEPLLLGGVINAVAAYGLSESGLLLPRSPLGQRDWPRFLSRVADERLTGLLGAAVSHGAFPVTDDQRAAAMAAHRVSMMRCLQLEAGLVSVAAALRKVPVRLRVLKGSAVANLDYHDVSLRPFVDVDLLVQARDFDTAVETLERSGYRRQSPQPRAGFDSRFGKGATLRREHGATVDLHRTFVMGPFGQSIVLEDLWDSVETFNIAGHQIDALSPELRLVHACYHAVLGDWPRRLLPHRDIAQLVLGGKCNPTVVRDLSHRWRGDAVLALAIRETWDVLRIDAVTTLSAWARSENLRAHDMKLVGLYQRETVSYSALSLAALARINSPLDKIRFLRALAMPQRKYAREHHTSSAARLLDAVRKLGPRPED